MPAKTPFSEDEKDLVQDLVLKYKAVIENKRTDAISINAKAKAWEKLHGLQQQALCAPSGRQAAKKAVGQPEAKVEAGESEANPRRPHYRYPPPPPMDERLAHIEGIVPHLTTRVPNPFDSDWPLATPAAQSASEILNGLICENGPAGSDQPCGRLLYFSVYLVTVQNAQTKYDILTEQNNSAKPTSSYAVNAAELLHPSWLVKIAYAWTIPKSMRT
ncbi:hypothetical protein HPB51_027912 [Rhipicephalus microplus]|uniref:Regulatory protein zeste n=1 Tax=Rhipicephalus microplus TaxID=6941 RepID=A0A9J6CYY3_RHIMP|nr:hypothetical protein HPB51_027912 [Rhipicephalus microplus]